MVYRSSLEYKQVNSNHHIFFKQDKTQHFQDYLMLLDMLSQIMNALSPNERKQTKLSRLKLAISYYFFVVFS